MQTRLQSWRPPLPGICCKCHLFSNVSKILGRKNSKESFQFAGGIGAQQLWEIPKPCTILDAVTVMALEWLRMTAKQLDGLQKQRCVESVCETCACGIFHCAVMHTFVFLATRWSFQLWRLPPLRLKHYFVAVSRICPCNR